METKKAQKGEMEKKHVYGSDIFMLELHKRYAISPLIRHVGRPRKERELNN